MYTFVPIPELEFVISNAATTIYPAAITLWCLVFKKESTSLNTAIGATAVPFLLRSLYSVVKNKPQEMGYAAWSEYVSLAVHSVVTAAALADSPFAEIAIKVWVMWYLTAGAVYLVNPSSYAVELAAEKGSKQQRDVEIVNRALGNDLLCAGFFFGPLSLGVECIKAYGYAWLAGGSGILSILLFTRDCHDLGIVGPSYVWVGLMLTIGAICAFT